MVAKQPGRAIDYPYPVPKVRMHGTIPPLTHTCTAWWVMKYGSDFYLYKTNNISYSKANFSPVL
jgi:hypothetical protein